MPYGFESDIFFSGAIHKEVIKKDIARENPDFIGVFTVYTAKFQRTVLTDIKMMFSLCWMS